MNDGIVLLDEFDGKRIYFVQGRVTYVDEVEVIASSEEEARHLGACRLSALHSDTTDVHVTDVYIQE